MVSSGPSAAEELPLRSVSYGTVLQPGISNQPLGNIQPRHWSLRQHIPTSFRSLSGIITILLFSGILAFAIFQDEISNLHYRMEEGLLQARRIFGEVIEEREFDFAIEARKAYPLVTYLRKPRYEELLRNYFLVKWPSTRVENYYIYRHTSFCPWDLDAVHCKCLPANCLRVIHNQLLSVKNRKGCRCKWMTSFNHDNERYCFTTPKLKMRCVNKRASPKGMGLPHRNGPSPSPKQKGPVRPTSHPSTRPSGTIPPGRLPPAPSGTKKPHHSHSLPHSPSPSPRPAPKRDWNGFGKDLGNIF